MTIHLKRVYEPALARDGYRILVERLWPRGLTKDKAAIDFWHKDIAPSPELRKWYSHDVSKWERFCQRYRDELNQNPDKVLQLQQAIAAARGPVTFVYAARDEQHNSALVLKAYLKDR